MVRVASAEIEATLKAVDARWGPDIDGPQHRTQVQWEPAPFDLLAPEPGRARRVAEALVERKTAGTSGDVDLWSLALESAVTAAVRAGDLDTAASLGRAATRLGPAGFEAADCAAAFIVSRRDSGGSFLCSGPGSSSGTAGASTVAACVRALREIVQSRSALDQSKMGHI